MPRAEHETELGRLLKEFLEYLEITKNRSAATIENYRFYLKRFFFSMRITRATEITSDCIKRYRLLLNRWADRRGERLSKTTQNYHLIAIRSLLKYLAKEDHACLAAEKVELMKLPDRQVDFLESSDLDALLAQPLKQKNGSIIQRRDKARKIYP